MLCLCKTQSLGFCRRRRSGVRMKQQHVLGPPHKRLSGAWSNCRFVCERHRERWRHCSLTLAAGVVVGAWCILPTAHAALLLSALKPRQSSDAHSTAVLGCCSPRLFAPSQHNSAKQQQVKPSLQKQWLQQRLLLQRSVQQRVCHPPALLRLLLPPEQPRPRPQVPLLNHNHPQPQQPALQLLVAQREAHLHLMRNNSSRRQQQHRLAQQTPVLQQRLAATLMLSRPLAHQQTGHQQQ